MKTSFKFLSYFLILTVLLLLDQQLSFFFDLFISGKWEFHSFIFLIFLLYVSLDLSSSLLFYLSLLLGALYDLYCLNRLGVMIIVLPVLALILSKMNDLFLENPWNRLSTVLIIVFTVDLILSTYGFILGYSSLSFEEILFYQVAPSLCLNIGIYLFLQPIIKKLHLI